MDPVLLPWRTHPATPRLIFAQLADTPSDSDPFIGLMDTPELATEACAAHNIALITEKRG